MDNCVRCHNIENSSILRTFGNSRSGNFRTQAGFRNPPSSDPAVETNEIAPARQLTADAPNAPGFAQQGVRRPPGGPGNAGGAANTLRRVVDRMVGGMRNMFQGFSRRAGSDPSRRNQFQPQQQREHQAEQERFLQPEHQVSHLSSTRSVNTVFINPL